MSYKFKQNNTFILIILVLSFLQYSSANNLVNTNPLITNIDDFSTPRKSFYEKHESNWRDKENFNSKTTKTIFFRKQQLTKVELSSFKKSSKKFTNSKSSSNGTFVINKTLTSGSDDSFQLNDNSNHPNSYEVPSDNVRWKGFRFKNLNIPSNALISSAVLEIHAYKTRNYNFSGNIARVKGEYLKSPSTFGGSNNYLYNLSKTSEYKDWTIPNISNNGQAIYSPNLKEIVQEVVNDKNGVTHLSLILSTSESWITWNYEDGDSNCYATVRVEYTLQNVAIDTNNDTAVTNSGSSVIVDISNNDANIPTDGNLTITNLPNNGTASINTNGTSNDITDDTIIYTANANFTGTDSLNYRVCDSNNNNCDTSSVTINVSALPSDPCSAASGNLDTDGDGISDICDLDDDNDGILDTDECSGSGTSKLDWSTLGIVDQAPIHDGSVYTVDGIPITINYSTEINGGTFVPANQYFSSYEAGQRGAFFGYAELGFNNSADDYRDRLIFTMSFGKATSGINFTITDIDQAVDDSWDDAVEIFYTTASGTYNIKTQPTYYTLNSVVALDNESDIDGFEGIGNAEIGETKGNLLLDFKNESITSIRIEYFSTNDAISNPEDQYIGITDITFDKCGDSDNDGIPDYLDTDSDNDGCPDATEGANNLVTKLDLNNGSNGGSSANLGTTSNSNGIPTDAVVNATTGQANTAATTIAEEITINSAPINQNVTANNTVNFSVSASAIKTTLFNNSGTPNYSSGTNSTNTLTYKWFKNSNPNTTLATSSTLTIHNVATSDTGDYTVQIKGTNNNCSSIATATLTVDAADPCDAVASGNIDTDNDGISDMCDLDDDNDGILDTEEGEGSCDQSNIANSTSGVGNYQDQLYFFNWSGSDFTDGVHNNDTQTFTLPGNLIITATISNAMNASSYVPTDMNTYSGATLYKLYNTTGTKEALYGANGEDTSFTVNFTATKNGNPYPLDFLTLDPESTDTGEHVEFSTNGESWKVLETVGNGGTWTGVGSKTVKTTNTNKSQGNTIYYSYNATKIDVDLNAGGRQAVAFGIWLKCDTDNDGILNHRDTDSDNDGCPDTTEAVANLTPSGTLNGGSVNGSSANLGTVSNNNGIPLPLGTVNGNETTGQASTTAVNTAEKMTLITSPTNQSINENGSVTFSVQVNAVTTTTYNAGSPDYNSGTDTSNSLKYKWFKTSVPNTIISTNRYLTLNNLMASNAGDYSVKVIGANNTCSITETATLSIESNNICDAVSSGNMDTDTDGISDICDLDDDNDGILDNDENCSGFISQNTNGVWKGKTNSNVTYTYTNTNTQSTQSSFDDNQTAYSINKNGGEQRVEKRGNTNFTISFSPAIPANEIAFAIIDVDVKESEPVNSNFTPTFATYNLKINGGNNPNGVFLSATDKLNNLPQLNYNTSSGLVTMNGDKENQYLILKGKSNNLISSITLTSTNISNNSEISGDLISYSILAKEECDTDKDGISDSLDTDSDNDGCADAKEAASNLSTTATLSGGSNGGSSANLGTNVNANGIPTIAATNATTGQATTTAVTTAELITIDTAPSNSTTNENTTASLTITASAVKTSTFNSGSPLYSNPNGVSTTGSLAYKWFKDSAPNTILSTTSNLNINNLTVAETGDYTVQIFGSNNKCYIEETATISINYLPTAEDDTITGIAEGSINSQINVLANNGNNADSFGTDGPNIGAITLPTTTTTEGGTVTVDDKGNNDPTDDIILYTPLDNNFYGTDTFDYTITDSNGDTSTATVTIYVSSVNDAPTAVNDNYTTLEDTPKVLKPLTKGTNDSDPENDTLTITSINNELIAIGTAKTIVVPNGSVTYSQTGVITFIPNANFTGTVQFPYTISDGNGGTDSGIETIVIEPIKDAPIATDDSYTTDEDAAIIITPLTQGSPDSDPDNDTLTIISINSVNVTGAIQSIPVTDGVVNININGVLTFTPNLNYNGTVTFPYTISDGNGGNDSATETIVINPINDAPLATDDSYTTDEDTVVTITPLTTGTADSDPENDTLTITSINNVNVTGDIQSITVDNGTVNIDPFAIITFTPNSGFNGTVTFPYTISDGNGENDSATETIVINPVNDAPIATDDSYKTDEDISISITPLIKGTADSDPENDSLTVTSINGASILIGTDKTIAVTNGSVTYNGTTNDITFTPDTNFTGTVTFPYTISDGNGGTDNAIETIVINPINDTPLATDDSYTTDEDVSINLTPLTTGTADSDPENDTLTVTSINNVNVTGGIQSITVDNGTINLDFFAVITFTPNSDYNGTVTFPYTISDGNGGTDNAIETIIITPINDAPIATDDTYTTDEDVAIILNPLNAGIADKDPENDTLTITSINGVNFSGGIQTITVTNGIVEIDATGVIILTPNPNFNGTITFPYTISDENGSLDTAIETIIVNPINDAPIATNDDFVTDEDTSLVINPLTDGIADSDPDNDTLTITAINGVNITGGVQSIPVDNGNIDIDNNGKITYTPNLDFNGTITFPYVISDSNGGTDNATETIVINSINDVPDAVDITVVDPIDENSINNVIDVLTNDTFGGDGPNNGAITLVSANTANGGTVTVNNNDTPNNPTDDTILYTPVAGFNGQDSFKYSITDLNGDTDTAIVSLTIKPDGTPYNPTSPAECFNVFVENNITVSNGNTFGSVAAGGDLTLNGDYSIASEECGCYTVNGNGIGLLVGGKVNYPVNNSVLTIANPNQYLKIGESNGSSAWYQDPNNNYNPIRITFNSDYNASSHIQLQGAANALNVSANNNPVFENNLIDFASAFQQLKTNSVSLSQGVHNAQLTDSNGNTVSNTNLPPNVRIDLQNGINYLNVSGTELNSVNTFTFNQQPSANNVLIINIDDSGLFNWNVWEQVSAGLTESPYILYNFFNATELHIIGNQTIAGTILAPFAEITKTVNTANILGQIIGKSLIQDGGNLECAAFVPIVISPPTTGVPPTAEFTVNDNEQCLAGNEFVFNNTSNTENTQQPGNPISYLWNFGDGTFSSLMNPSKTFAGAGTYDVILTATNSFGSNTQTTQVTVTNTINHPIVTKATLTSPPGTVTREFTLDNDTYFDNYSWALDGVGTNLFPNQKVVTFDFTTDGSYNLSATGFKNGCTQTLTLPIVISSGEVTGGNGGGVESESLGDAISKIYVKRKKNSVATKFVKSSKNLYNKAKLLKAQPYQGKTQTMLEMFPTELITGNVANVTSPTDILDYTVADEVLSVDFSINGQTKGVVLGIKTTDKIYNHTKASCDRLRGAEILNIQTVELEGYNFLMQGIKQRNGVIEYAISFVAAKNTTDTNYIIQTNWYVNEYIKFNDVYNFQVWSSNYEDTQKLVKDILENLNAYVPVMQEEKQRVPRTFAAKLTREKSDLVIKLKSNEIGLNTEISMDEVYTETTTTLKHRYNSLNTTLEQTLVVDIKDGYEYDGLIKVDGAIQDAFYHADGNWGLDYDKQYTQVNEYIVSNNFDREYLDDEHEIHRDVKIKAISELDYLGIYKSLLPGNLSADYSEYKYLTFTAKGSGLIELGLIKSSVQEWKEQYRVMVNLSEEEQTYYIPFDAFTSTGTTDKIVADDLTTITFTFLPVEANTKELDLTISDVKFAKTTSEAENPDVIEEFENNFMTYPNPTNGSVNVLLFSKVDTEATISLYDVTGKQIYSAPARLTVGKNELDFSVFIKPGIMFLKVNSKEINYGTSKIIFR